MPFTEQELQLIANTVFAKINGNMDRFIGAFSVTMIRRGWGIYSDYEYQEAKRRIRKMVLDMGAKYTSSEPKPKLWKSGIEHKLPPDDRD